MVLSIIWYLTKSYISLKIMSMEYTGYRHPFVRFCFFSYFINASYENREKRFECHNFSYEDNSYNVNWTYVIVVRGFFIATPIGHNKFLGIVRSTISWKLKFILIFQLTFFSFFHITPIRGLRFSLDRSFVLDTIWGSLASMENS